jgi:hypothetical protein
MSAARQYKLWRSVAAYCRYAWNAKYLVEALLRRRKGEGDEA